MSLKAKILTSLKTKYKTLGLSDKVMDGIADMLAVTTTEEDKIETAVDGVEALLKGIQSDADARVTTAVNKAKAEKVEPEKKEGGSNEPSKEQSSDLTKAIQDAIKPLVDKVNSLENGKVTDARKLQLEAKLKDTNPVLSSSILEGFEHRTFENDEAFNAYLQSIETKVGEFDKYIVDNNLGAVGRVGKPNSGTNKEASKEEIESIVNQIM